MTPIIPHRRIGNHEEARNVLGAKEIAEVEKENRRRNTEVPGASSLNCFLEFVRFFLLTDCLTNVTSGRT